MSFTSAFDTFMDLLEQHCSEVSDDKFVAYRDEFIKGIENYECFYGTLSDLSLSGYDIYMTHREAFEELGVLKTKGLEVWAALNLESSEVLILDGNHRVNTFKETKQIFSIKLIPINDLPNDFLTYRLFN